MGALQHEENKRRKRVIHKKRLNELGHRSKYKYMNLSKKRKNEMSQLVMMFICDLSLNTSSNNSNAYKSMY